MGQSNVRPASSTPLTPALLRLDPMFDPLHKIRVEPDNKRLTPMHQDGFNSLQKGKSAYIRPAHRRAEPRWYLAPR